MWIVTDLPARKVLCLFVLAFLTVFFVVNALPSEAMAELDLSVHNTDTGLDYGTMQEAINDPETLDGHTIQVDAGEHRERLVVNKSVKLVGANKFNTIIDGEDAGTVIYIAADNVQIAGFTIQNGGPSHSGVYINHSDGINITQNIIRNNEIGVYLNRSSNNIFSSNNVSNNYMGVYTESSSNNVFSCNNISNIWSGIHLESSSNNVLSCNNISENHYGVYLESSNSNVLSRNIASNNLYGMWLNASNSNVLLDNDAGDADNGFRFVSSTNNTLLVNTASNNYIGVFFESSNENTVFHNNFVNNTIQARVTPGFTNTWDKGYPSGGNYWSDYAGTDYNFGDHQNVTGSDGVGDTLYLVDANNTDHYPLMARTRYFSLNLGEETYSLSTVCNSTIIDFRFDGSTNTINFDVAGSNNKPGFCRLTVPYAVINAPYIVLVDGEEVDSVPSVSNGSHAFFYITIIPGTHQVTVASKPYYELQEKYNSLLADYQNLNQILFETMGYYTQLIAKHARLQEDFESLNSTYLLLQEEFESLNATYHATVGDYDSLKIVFDALLGQYDWLNSTYENLLDSFDELQSKYESTSDEMAAIRNIMYMFIAATVIGVAFLLPFGVKYYRISTEQKRIIQLYNPLEIARVLFKEDVERRGSKIKVFEEKYGVKIRPSDTLEDAIKSLRLKEKKGKKLAN